MARDLKPWLSDELFGVASEAIEHSLNGDPKPEKLVEDNEECIKLDMSMSKPRLLQLRKVEKTEGPPHAYYTLSDGAIFIKAIITTRAGESHERQHHTKIENSAGALIVLKRWEFRLQYHFIPSIQEDIGGKLFTLFVRSFKEHAPPMQLLHRPVPLMKTEKFFMLGKQLLKCKKPLRPLSQGVAETAMAASRTSPPKRKLDHNDKGQHTDRLKVAKKNNAKDYEVSRDQNGPWTRLQLGSKESFVPRDQSLIFERSEADSWRPLSTGTLVPIINLPTEALRNFTDKIDSLNSLNATSESEDEAGNENQGMSKDGCEIDGNITAGHEEASTKLYGSKAPDAAPSSMPITDDDSEEEIVVGSQDWPPSSPVPQNNTRVLPPDSDDENKPVRPREHDKPIATMDHEEESITPLSQVSTKRAKRTVKIQEPYRQDVSEAVSSEVKTEDKKRISSNKSLAERQNEVSHGNQVLKVSPNLIDALAENVHAPLLQDPDEPLQQSGKTRTHDDDAEPAPLATIDPGSRIFRNSTAKSEPVDAQGRDHEDVQLENPAKGGHRSYPDAIEITSQPGQDQNRSTYDSDVESEIETAAPNALEGSDQNDRHVHLTPAQAPREGVIQVKRTPAAHFQQAKAKAVVSSSDTTVPATFGSNDQSAAQQLEEYLANHDSSRLNYGVVNPVKKRTATEASLLQSRTKKRGRLVVDTSALDLSTEIIKGPRSEGRRMKEEHLAEQRKLRQRSTTDDDHKTISLHQSSGYPSTKDTVEYPAPSLIELNTTETRTALPAGNPSLDHESDDKPEQEDSNDVPVEDTLGDCEPILYQNFKTRYPAYQGGLKHFIKMVTVVQNLRANSGFHHSLWDDFVIRNLTDYQPYINKCFTEGEDFITDYYQYWNDLEDGPNYTLRVLTPKNIATVCPDVEPLPLTPSRASLSEHIARSIETASLQNTASLQTTTLNPPAQGQAFLSNSDRARAPPAISRTPRSLPWDRQPGSIPTPTSKSPNNNGINNRSPLIDRGDSVSLGTSPAAPTAKHSYNLSRRATEFSTPGGVPARPLASPITKENAIYKTPKIPIPKSKFALNETPEHGCQPSTGEANPASIAEKAHPRLSCHDKVTAPQELGSASSNRSVSSTASDRGTPAAGWSKNKKETASLFASFARKKK